MKVDLEYFAKPLAVFTDAETANIAVEDIHEAGIKVASDSELDENFVFHVQLALDNQLIAQKHAPAYNLEDIGICESIDGFVTLVAKPIRLTQIGHDFSATLNNKEVLSKLKSEFKDAPFKVIFEGGQKLLQHFMKKKLDDILEEGA